MAADERREEQPIRISLDDIANVQVTPAEHAMTAAIPAAAGPKSYGKISAEPSAPEIAETKGQLYMQGWFYLGAAGLIGAVAGWGICEPWFDDGVPGGWAQALLLPLIITLMCVGFATAESIVERSVKRALSRGGIAVLLGMIFGFVFYMVANLAFAIGLGVISQMGVQSHEHPLFWIARGIAWAVFGVAGGLVYGFAGQSSKKGMYGVLGGAIGALIGGSIFDPIGNLFDTGDVSRFVGFALLGLSTGIAIGWVESALKDRWLYVCAGPLSGKQFILYKPRTVFGSSQGCDIYLFKDAAVQPEHAIVELVGSRARLRAAAPVYVGGQPTRDRVLMTGDLIQIGRYAFRYLERQRG